MADKNYHHGNLREALINTGLELLEETNVEQISLRAIAARVGVSHAAPKNHFGSLKGLLTAIVTRGFEDHASLLAKAGSVANDDPKSRLEAVAQAYVDFGISRPNLFGLMFSCTHTDWEDPTLLTAARASYATLEQATGPIDWRNRDHPDNKPMTEMMIWSLVHGYAHLVINRQFGASIQSTPYPVANILPDLSFVDPKIPDP